MTQTTQNNVTGPKNNDRLQQFPYLTRINGSHSRANLGMTKEKFIKINSSHPQITVVNKTEQ